MDTDAVLLESNFDVDGHHAIFGRAEYARKAPQTWSSPTVALGYWYSFGDLISLVPTIGVRGSIGVVPNALEPEYGSQAPLGAMVFVRISPAEMEMAHREEERVAEQKPSETARADHAAHR